MTFIMTVFMTNHLLLVICWVLFGVVHSLLAANWFKRVVQQLANRYFIYYRVGYTVLAFIMMTVVLIYQFSVDSILVWHMPVELKSLFLLPGIAGVIIMALAIRKYFYLLSGIRVFGKIKYKHALELGGLHRYVRHPLYAGTLLFIWSLLIFMPLVSHLLACIMITIYTLIGIQLEEKKLIAEFGDVYLNYKKKVPMIIPFLRR